MFQLLLKINFSSRTTSMDVQRNIEANVEKRTKDTYGPPPGKRLLIFIDEMNMPQVTACSFYVYCLLLILVTTPPGGREADSASIICSVLFLA